MYTESSCPVALRASSFRNTARSCARGITFSIPATAMWIFGAEVVKRALPSFSIMATAPESAIRKLAPLMPMSAFRNFSRSTARAITVSFSGTVSRSTFNSLVKISATS